MMTCVSGVLFVGLGCGMLYEMAGVSISEGECYRAAVVDCPEGGTDIAVC